MLGMLTSEIMNGHMDALAIGRKCAKCERHREKTEIMDIRTGWSPYGRGVQWEVVVALNWPLVRFIVICKIHLTIIAHFLFFYFHQRRLMLSILF